MENPLNVLGLPIRPCSHDPLTGWFRDGCCNTDAHDRGSHTVCAVVTQDFLLALAEAGNDLISPMPQHGFPGLKPGDQWCVCAASWRRAAEEGRGCPVHLEGTHAAALRVVPLELLMQHALAEEA
jgi:uncharacterized protein (DUF2237 family)